jgi:hypothetical protein
LDYLKPVLNKKKIVKTFDVANDTPIKKEDKVTTEVIKQEVVEKS